MSKDFDLVYDTYADMIYRLCFVMLRGNRHDAEDAAQNVFLKYIESPERPQGEHLKAWFIVVARNECRSRLRGLRRLIPSESLPEDAEDFPYGETLGAVLELPERERTAVYLCLYEGYTAAEAAKLMDSRENTVYSYLHRARKKLRKALGE